MKKKIVLSVAVVLLVVMIAVMCVACTPSVESVTKKYEKNEYKGGSTTIDGHSAAVFTKNIVNTVTIVWFDNKDDAQAYYDAQVKIWGKDCVAKKGNAVAFGTTKEAVAIF